MRGPPLLSWTTSPTLKVVAMSSSFHHRAVDARAVTIIARAPDSQTVVRFGQQVRLRSGGPIGLAVARSGPQMTVAWPGGSETTLPAICLSPV